MAVRVELHYDKTIPVRIGLESALDYFCDFEHSIPECFPGIEKFGRVSDNLYEWTFQKFEYSGFTFQVHFWTSILRSGNIITLTPHQPQETALSGTWAFSETVAGLELKFNAYFTTELDIPSLFKSMATALVSKELTKLFDRYSANVEKKLS